MSQGVQTVTSSWHPKLCPVHGCNPSLLGSVVLSSYPCCMYMFTTISPCGVNRAVIALSGLLYVHTWVLMYCPRALTSPHTECEQLIRRMLVTNPVKWQSLSKVLAHKWMVVDGKGGAGSGIGLAMNEVKRVSRSMEQTGRWESFVLSFVFLLLVL